MDSTCGGRDCLARDIIVRNNVFHDAKIIGLGIHARGGAYAENTNTVRNVSVYNNVIDGKTSAEGGQEWIDNGWFRTSRGIDIRNEVKDTTWPVGGKSYGVLEDIRIRNNHIQDVSGSAFFVTETTINNMVVDHNNYYNDNVIFSWSQGSQTNAKFLEPDFMGPVGQSYLSYEHYSGSALIDAGVDVGLPYVGLAPDIGAIEYD